MQPHSCITKAKNVLLHSSLQSLASGAHPSPLDYHPSSKLPLVFTQHCTGLGKQAAVHWVLCRPILTRKSTTRRRDEEGVWRMVNEAHTPRYAAPSIPLPA